MAVTLCRLGAQIYSYFQQVLSVVEKIIITYLFNKYSIYLTYQTAFVEMVTLQ